MRFVYGLQDLCAKADPRGCYLLTNGLGGFSSQTLAGGASRNDHAALMACTQPPNRRWNLIHRLEETVAGPAGREHLSSQDFPEGPAEAGWKHLVRVQVDGLPEWLWQVRGVRVRKTLALGFEANTLAVRYELRNDGDGPCTLAVTPWMQFAPKGEDMPAGQALTWTGDGVACAGLRLRLQTNGRVRPFAERRQRLYYADDERDGRRSEGTAAAVHTVELTLPAGESGALELVYTLEEAAPAAGAVIEAARARLAALVEQAGLADPTARQLVRAADAFVARRKSTGGKTILAGYPFFEDWGRDTMIALPGCTLVTRRFEDAKSILRTFMAHERKGLMPNLFPEGGCEPRYNTADAALLFIHCVWQYVQASGDEGFAREAWPVMQRILKGYREGTDHGIRQDADGLILAGQGLDQVTWMDVRIGDHLPTPRHGKPVEINAHWHAALCSLARMAPLAGEDPAPYEREAERVRAAFRRAFWREEAGCLRDVVSGTAADEQIRCNQIWAAATPFPLLEPAQERAVVDTVRRLLYTPVGLRTLDPADLEFHPVYGGPQSQRDLAYHQGTVWAFPLGAYYLAVLKVSGNSPAARARVRQELEALIPALREGCVGQLPEIYDGLTPAGSRGCFAQAWSVGELLRVFARLEEPDEG